MKGNQKLMEKKKQVDRLLGYPRSYELSVRNRGYRLQQCMYHKIRILTNLA